MATPKTEIFRGRRGFLRSQASFASTTLCTKDTKNNWIRFAGKTRQAPLFV